MSYNAMCCQGKHLGKKYSLKSELQCTVLQGETPELNTPWKKSDNILC